MKKLIVLSAAICLAITSQAAVANWKATAANIYDGTGTTTKYSGTAYFFNSGITSQESLYSIIAAGTAITDKTDGYVAQGTVANGSISGVTFAYGEQSESTAAKNYYNFYFVIVDDDMAYFSNTKNVGANATVASASVAFASQATGSQLAPTAAGYAGEGKWSSVPEPTSAMLLMLGLCGLALKRKNA